MGRVTRLAGLRLLPWVLIVALASVGALSCASARGSYHTVRSGENLYRIGLRHGVPAKEIMRANRIRQPQDLRAGQRIWIPNPPEGRAPPKQYAQAKPPQGAKASKGASRPPNSQPTVRKKTRDRAAQRAAFKATRQEVRARVRKDADLIFGWPLQKGRLVSRFGFRWGKRHKGIDIAAPTGTQIRAAESGRVIHAGRLGSFGNVVVIGHNGRYRTLYAHASKTFVRRGQRVKQGQRIAAVGSTGNSTGPHLHFEIRKGENARDPLLFLP